MSSIRVSGNTSGHYDLTVPDVAGSNTIALDKIVVADSNGFVGIGTTTAYSASTDFEVKATDPKIVINNTGQRAFGLLASGTKLHIRDESDNQDLVTITEGGNVGIGTSSPSAMLDVAGSVQLGGSDAQNRLIQMGTGVNPIYMGGANTNTINVAHDYDGTYSMHLNYNGYNGGTTHYRDLVINDGRHANIAEFNGSTKHALFYGNVGIGTSGPDEKLDVHGHIKMTNSYLKVRRSATYDQAWDIGITHASASQHGSLFIYPPPSQTIQSTSGVVIGTGNTGSNYPFILNGDGILTMDHQPSANVYIIAGNLGAYNNASSNSVLVATGIRHNIGSHYNTSNGRFTCPTSGRYFVSFSANWYNNGAGSWLRPQIRRNGATHCQHYENTASNPVWMHISASTVIDCSAGDYLEIYNQTQNGAGGGMDTNQYSNINFHKIA